MKAVDSASRGCQTRQLQLSWLSEYDLLLTFAKEHDMKKWMAFFAVAFFAADGRGEEPLAWPQFRGPNGSGVADGQQPPVEVGPDKNVKWKVPVPSGLSSPIVVGDKLVITAFDGGKLFTIAYDRANGNELWRAEAPAREHRALQQGRRKPGRIDPCNRRRAHRFLLRLVWFVLLRPRRAKELWKFEMPPWCVAGDFGSGVSPIIADGTVVLVRDQVKDSKIVAIDVATGTPRWEKQRQSPASYCTPVVWDTPAGKQIVAAGHVRMTGYDLKSGAEKWFVRRYTIRMRASPVVVEQSPLLRGWSPSGPDDKEFQMPRSTIF